MLELALVGGLIWYFTKKPKEDTNEAIKDKIKDVKVETKTAQLNPNIKNIVNAGKAITNIANKLPNRPPPRTVSPEKLAEINAKKKEETELAIQKAMDESKITRNENNSAVFPKYKGASVRVTTVPKVGYKPTQNVKVSVRDNVKHRAVRDNISDLIEQQG